MPSPPSQGAPQAHPAHVTASAVLASKLPRHLLTAAAAVIVIGGLRAARDPVIALLIASFLAILSYPLVTWLHDRRVPRIVAILGVVVLDAAVLLAIGILFAGLVSDLMVDPSRLQARIDQLLSELTTWLRTFGVRVPERRIEELVEASSIVSVVSNTIGTLAMAISSTMLIVLTMIFILVEAASLPWKLRAAMGNARADLSALSRIMCEVQRYLRLKTVLNLATGACMAGILAVAGVKYALVWGVVVVFVNYVPTVGSLIAALATMAITAAQRGLFAAVMVGIASIVVHTIILGIIEPAWLGRRFGLSVLVVFLSLIVWGWILGPTGMLFAVPLTVVVKIGLENSSEHRWLAIMLEPSPMPPRPPKRRRWMKRAEATR